MNHACTGDTSWHDIACRSFFCSIEIASSELSGKPPTALMSNTLAFQICNITFKNYMCIISRLFIVSEFTLHKKNAFSLWILVFNIHIHKKMVFETTSYIQNRFHISHTLCSKYHLEHYQHSEYHPQILKNAYAFMYKSLGRHWFGMTLSHVTLCSQYQLIFIVNKSDMLLLFLFFLSIQISLKAK